MLLYLWNFSVPNRTARRSNSYVEEALLSCALRVREVYAMGCLTPLRPWDSTAPKAAALASVCSIKFKKKLAPFLSQGAVRWLFWRLPVALGPTKILSIFPQNIEWSGDICKTRNKLVIVINHHNKAGKFLFLLLLRARQLLHRMHHSLRLIVQP